MGDSNIAPIPTFKRSEVQAHSFPRATLRHLTAVLLRFPSPRPGIRPVVFRSVFLWARWLCHRQQLPGTVLPSPLPTMGPPPSPATHHGTTTVTVSSQKSSHQMNLHLRGPSNNQHTTIHHPLSRVPPHSIQTLDSNLSHSQPPQGDNPPRRRTGVTSGLAKNLRAMMKGPTKIPPSSGPHHRPGLVQSTSTASQRTVQLRLHRALHSASLSHLTVTPERRRPSGTTDPKPRPNKTMFKRTRHDPTGHTGQPVGAGARGSSGKGDRSRRGPRVRRAAHSTESTPSLSSCLPLDSSPSVGPSPPFVHLALPAQVFLVLRLRLLGGRGFRRLWGPPAVYPGLDSPG
ncbi:unnamed protein product [Boreogadus saida]